MTSERIHLLTRGLLLVLKILLMTKREILGARVYHRLQVKSLKDFDFYLVRNPLSCIVCHESKCFLKRTPYSVIEQRASLIGEIGESRCRCTVAGPVEAQRRSVGGFFVQTDCPAPLSSVPRVKPAGQGVGGLSTSRMSPSATANGSPPERITARSFALAKSNIAYRTTSDLPCQSLGW